jgi:WD40 repeat protein
VQQAAFSPDGWLILTRLEDKTLKLWDIATSREVPLQPRPTGVLLAGFSPDGRLLVAAGLEKCARVSSTSTGLLHLPDPLRHDGTVTGTSFSPDGRLIVTASEDKTARPWDTETGRPHGSP